jgi:hypothetical protein
MTDKEEEDLFENVSTLQVPDMTLRKPAKLRGILKKSNLSKQQPTSVLFLDKRPLRQETRGARNFWTAISTSQKQQQSDQAQSHVTARGTIHTTIPIFPNTQQSVRTNVQHQQAH